MWEENEFHKGKKERDFINILRTLEKTLIVNILLSLLHAMLNNFYLTLLLLVNVVSCRKPKLCKHITSKSSFTKVSYATMNKLSENGRRLIASRTFLLSAYPFQCDHVLDELEILSPAWIAREICRGSLRYLDSLIDSNFVAILRGRERQNSIFNLDWTPAGQV